MANYKEIVTKAVIGKGKKQFKDTYTMNTEVEPTTVLGCWVINHKFKGYESNGKIIIEGSYDVNIWYSHDGDSRTSVVTKKVDYSNTVSVKAKDYTEINSDRNIIVRCLKQPSCTNVNIKDGNIEFIIEKELGIEIVGDTKVKILVEDNEEPWDIIVDEEYTSEIDKEINESIKEEFLTDNK